MNTTKPLGLISLGVLVAVTAGIAVIGIYDSTPIETGEVANPAPIIEAVGEGRYTLDAEFPEVLFELIYADSNLQQSVKYVAGAKGIVFRSDELLPGDTTFTWGVERSFSTAYNVVSVVHSGQANLLYVIGRGRGYADIVERWVVSPLLGSPIASRWLSSYPVGNPLAPAPLISGFAGGQWIEPGARSGSVLLDRTEIYRGSSLGAIGPAVADPDGRFVMALFTLHSPTLERGLYRLDVGDNLAVPVSVLDSSQYPAINDVDAVYLWESAGSVRNIILEAPFASIPQMGVLYDLDNDGLFSLSEFSVYTFPQWLSGGLNEDVAWVSKFLEFY